MTSALVPPLLIFFATDDSVDLQIIHKPRRTARELPHRLPGQRNPNRWRSCGSLVLGEADIIGGSGRLIISLRKLSIPCITIMFFWFLLPFLLSEVDIWVEIDIYTSNMPSPEAE